MFAVEAIQGRQRGIATVPTSSSTRLFPRNVLPSQSRQRRTCDSLYRRRYHPVAQVVTSAQIFTNLEHGFDILLTTSLLGLVRLWQNSPHGSVIAKNVQGLSIKRQGVSSFPFIYIGQRLKSNTEALRNHDWWGQSDLTAARWQSSSRGGCRDIKVSFADGVQNKRERYLRSRPKRRIWPLGESVRWYELCCTLLDGPERQASHESGDFRGSTN